MKPDNHTQFFYHTQSLLNIFCLMILPEILIQGDRRQPCTTPTCQCNSRSSPRGRDFKPWFLGSPYWCLSCPEGVLDGRFFPCWWHLGPPVRIATFHNKILISGPFEHFWFLVLAQFHVRGDACAPKIKSAQMGLKLKSYYETLLCWFEKW